MPWPFSGKASPRANSGDEDDKIDPKTVDLKVEQARKANEEYPAFKPSKFGHEERQMTNYIRKATGKNIWYYRDRMSVPRGPCSLPVLKQAWVQGIIDEGTLVWGSGLVDWIPIRNVRTLVAQVRTVEVQAATWVKKTFSLQPALNRARKQRADQRQGHRSEQVDRMF